MLSGVTREGSDTAISTKEVKLSYRYPLVEQYGDQ